MRKPNELPEAYLVRLRNYFSGTAREEYYQVAKEISALRKRCSDLEKEIEQRQETEESLTQWVDVLGTELDRLKEAVKLERREMSEECPCCGGKIAINQKEGCVDCYECPFGCALAHLPRIAAAMELAKWTIAINLTGADDPTASGVSDKHEGAEQRVLEVWNG